MGYSTKTKDSISSNNIKLTADKIIQILDQVRDEGKKSRRRWIWELMQNAKDIPNIYGQVSIEIELFPNKLLFKHNGDPFRIDNLTGLIQQVSSKPSNGSDEETTGKFGTGFISTHLLSDIIYVSGIVQETNEIPKKINKLALDRSGETSEELIPAIEIALRIVDEIDNDQKFPPVEDYLIHRTEDSKDNIFEYPLETPSAISAAEIGVDDLKNTLPLTLAFIPKIKEVKVINHIKNETTTFSCPKYNSEDTLSKIFVEIKEGKGIPTKRCFYTYSAKTGILAVEVNNFENNTIIEPVESHPFLFKDFPLVGTESFWFPFIINGKAFMPTERRDSIYITGDGKKVEHNRAIFKCLLSNCNDFINLLIDDCGINCNNRHILLQSSLPTDHLKEDSLEWYASEIQNNYRQLVDNKPLVKTGTGYYALNAVKVPYIHMGPEELQLEFYELCQPFINPNELPQKETLIQLHKQLGCYEERESWNTKVFYEIADLLEGIKSAGNLKDLVLYGIADKNETTTWLSKVFQFIVEQKKIELLNEYEVVPNQNHKFKKLEQLCSEDDTQPIPDPFIDVLSDLGKDLRNELLHREIKFDIGSHKKLTLLDINEAIDEFFNEEKNEGNNRIKIFLKRPDALTHVINILKIDSIDSTREAFRHKLFFAAKDLFGFDDDLIQVPNSSKFKYPAANRLMVSLINEEISNKKDIKLLSEQIKKDETQTIIWLSNYLELIDTAPDYKYFLKEGNIIPNRKNQLCAYEDLNNFGTEEQPLNDGIVNILNMFDPSIDYWKNLLAKNVKLRLPKTIKFDEVGNIITEHINSIKGKESYEKFRTPLLELIDWCSTEQTLADRYLPGFKEISNRIFFILTIENSAYSGGLIEILKDKANLEMLKTINDSGISKEQLNEFIELFPDGIPAKVMAFAKEESRLKREFNNLLEVGSKVEHLFMDILSEYKVENEIIHAGGGAYDIRIYNPKNKKSFYIELKSCHYKNSEPINMAVSQIKRAVKEIDSGTYSVVIIERSLNNEMDSDYIRNNTKYLRNPGQYLREIAANFDVIDKSANTNDVIDLKMNNAEFKGSLDYDWILDKIGDVGFVELLEDINRTLSDKI